MHFREIISGLENRQDIDIEIILKQRDAYKTADYATTGLPCAPAITIDEEVIVQGKGISDEQLEEIIRRETAWDRSTRGAATMGSAVSQSTRSPVCNHGVVMIHEDISIGEGAL